MILPLLPGLRLGCVREAAGLRESGRWPRPANVAKALAISRGVTLDDPRASEHTGATEAQPPIFSAVRATVSGLRRSIICA